MTATAVAEKGQFTDRWIVTLEDAPTLEFSGAQIGSLKRLPQSQIPLQATAPSTTGRAFDVLDPAVVDYERFLRDRQADFIGLAEATLGRKLEVDGSVQHVANAVIVEGLSAADRQLIASLPNVNSIERERVHKLQLSDGPELIGARALGAGLVNGLPATRGEGTIVGIIDSGINWGHEAFSDDPIHSEGYEYSNPYPAFLGLCAQANVPCNDKLVGVYDFTTDSTDGEDTDGHGTHVAGIAAGNEWREDLGGVAPRAHIVSYRVCTEPNPDDETAGTCQFGAILQAFDQAVRDGVDVVNYSIGGDPFNPWRDSEAVRIFNLLDAGIPFVTSAGNSGPEPETVGSPADAPWTFAVGNTTTRERFGRRITISGVGAWFIQYGTGPDLPLLPITNQPLRAGDAVGGTLEACEAFPANAFAGAVALLKRGDCFFVDKINNAEAAGAIAVIMINNVGGSPIVMGGVEETTIPGGMVSLTDGEEILAALRAAGGELPVSLPNAQLTIFSEDLGDQLNAGSSRGPAADAPNVMKPNVVAPGTNIQAAFIPNSTAVARLTGTSMASPHAAGSMALLKQLQPDWTPAMLTSVLETTAEAEPVFASGEPADIFDRGAGRIRVDLAARAGLYLPITRGEFTAANPEFGGDPGALNLAGLVNENCGESCTFTRTVTALRSGTWSVSSEGGLGVQVSPSQFSLSSGQSQALTITVTPVIGSNVLEHGSVVLSPPNVSAPVPGQAPLATQRLPIGVRALTGEVSLPDIVRIDAPANQGRTSIDLGFVDDLPAAAFGTSDLVPANTENFSLPQDPRNSNPYDGSEGTRTFLIDVPADAVGLWAEILASSSEDMDLFVGRDVNGDGAAQESEEQCRSASPIELERCIVEEPQAGRWWIVAQNWTANLPNDSVELEWAVLRSGNNSD
ncbi:MAG: S8 family serine peptidase, partial [Wenzhouxiangella sp.]|nr:S8 family serine peptidase [Wenzhouxiangella sp.]